MSFLGDLRHELAANGIRGRLAARIEAELADHLACDPGARLGTPAEIAERFAAELRVVRTRRSSLGAFAALGATGLLVFVLARNGGHSPGFALGVVAFSQIAFVAGVLAVLRAMRGRSAGDLRMAQRRALIALGAGAGVCACLALQTSPVALVALPLLLAAARSTRAASAITPRVPMAGLRADFGPHARLVLAALGLMAVGAIALQGIALEGSGWEGVIRGAIEAGGLGLGVTVLGRPLGLRA
jgi:hypothetical protein